MLNLLIVEDNLNYSKNLINLIMDTIPTIKIYKILTDGNEAIKNLMLKKENIDIILLDLDLPKLNGIELLKEIEIKNLEEYKNSIIVITGKMDMLSQVKKNCYLYSYIGKMQGLDCILKELKNLVKLKEKSEYEEKIKKELNYLNYSNKLIGTKYLYEILTLIAENEDLLGKDLKNNIYPIISKRHNVTIHSVKCNIHNATSIMNCDCPKEKIMKYFGFFDDKTEVKPKQVIEEILNKIKLQ